MVSAKDYDDYYKGEINKKISIFVDSDIHGYFRVGGYFKVSLPDISKVAKCRVTLVDDRGIVEYVIDSIRKHRGDNETVGFCWSLYGDFPKSEAGDE